MFDDPPLIHNESPPPTPEQIAARAAAIRAGWDKSTAEKRYCGPKRIAWTAPEVVPDEMLERLDA